MARALMLAQADVNRGVLDLRDFIYFGALIAATGSANGVYLVNLGIAVLATENIQQAVKDLQEIRKITDALDAVGNTTKALTKGYAIASASLAAFLLFSAYIDKVNLILGRADKPLMTAVNLADVGVFIAALIGSMLAYFFSSLGTQVTVVEMADQILPVEDTEVAQALALAVRQVRQRAIDHVQVPLRMLLQPRRRRRGHLLVLGLDHAQQLHLQFAVPEDELVP